MVGWVGYFPRFLRGLLPPAAPPPARRGRTPPEPTAPPPTPPEPTPPGPTPPEAARPGSGTEAGEPSALRPRAVGRLVRGRPPPR
ncbi:hypothetical protein CP974_17270 [Streptomyces fradiae ATCC 10745 = DSM 40063]|nr:hypothetical protein CP974_17270 [Streptomyces fradiae ATCC 10745 = DSM 40063]